jgi:hypothetical protein
MAAHLNPGRPVPAVLLATVAILTAGCLSNHAGGSAPLELPDMPAPGAAASIFAPGVVSSGDVFSSTLTPDNRVVVFTKFSPPRMVLLMSRLVDGHWTTATALPFSGTYRDLDPAFSPDGTRLYFSSWRPTDGLADTSTASDTWFAEYRGTSWSAPVRLAEPLNSVEIEMYPSVARNGTLYFDSFRSRPRRRLVYRAARRPDGSFGVPEALGAEINADSGASNAFVDPDERFLIFAASRPEGLGGIDLYISWRRGSGGFGPPRNLGPTVNTPGTEFCPFISRDGRYLFFTRISPSSSSPATRNVYVVRFDRLLESLKEH